MDEGVGTLKGAIGVIALIFALGIGSCMSNNTRTDDCEKIGAFSWKGKVYECSPRK